MSREVKPFSGVVADALKPLLEKIQDINTQMRNYLIGVRDGIGLNDTWKIDITKMEFVKEDEVIDAKDE